MEDIADTLIDIIRTANQNVADRRVTTEQADGFMVVSWWQDPASVVPPYAGKWSYEWFKTLSEANDYFNEQEAGEMRGFRPYHILPCRQGVPLGSKTIP